MLVHQADKVRVDQIALFFQGEPVELLIDLVGDMPHISLEEGVLLVGIEGSRVRRRLYIRRLRSRSRTTSRPSRGQKRERRENRSGVSRQSIGGQEICLAIP